MKLSIKVFALTLFASVCFTSSAPAASYVIGLSPYYDIADKEKVLQHIFLFVLQKAAPGDDITVCDAWNQQQVTRVSIPEGTTFQNNPQARARRLANAIVAIKNFVLPEHVHSRETAGAIRLPQFLDLAGSQLRTSGQSIRVILIGSPVYFGNSSGFDMREVYPSDANLTTGEGDSPWSIASHKNLLAGVTVHFTYLHDHFLNDLHRQKISRFLVLFVKEQSGCLATFAPDLSLAFERACESTSQSVVQAEIDPDDSKVEMRRVNLRPIPLWFPPTNQLAATVSPDAVQPVIVTNVVVVPVAQASSTPATPSRAAQQDEGVGIGIYWASDCDFDLYVKANPTARELYFRNTTAPEGEYFHDFRGNRVDKSDYEFVQVKPGTDLRQVRAWVNLYSGRTSSPFGVAIVHYQGKTYQAPFTIKAKSGNHGDDSEKRSASRYWTEIDLGKIVSLSR